LPCLGGLKERVLQASEFCEVPAKRGSLLLGGRVSPGIKLPDDVPAQLFLSPLWWALPQLNRFSLAFEVPPEILEGPPEGLCPLFARYCRGISDNRTSPLVTFSGVDGLDFGLRRRATRGGEKFLIGEKSL
jgi:hypothetical protein